MTPYVIYHNPRCSKSRQTLQRLRDAGVEPQIVEYLTTPPDAATLDGILRTLGLEPADIVRRGEAVYTELDLANRSLSRDEWLATLAANPILIERPIVVHGSAACLGRPPENVDALL